jgi:hypothetical protein
MMPAPWCAVVNIGGGDVHRDGEYQTAAQCAPNVIADNGGFYKLNPVTCLGKLAPSFTKHRNQAH